MPDSSFVTVNGPDGDQAVEVSSALAKFERWLEEKGYRRAVDVCPYDSGEGGYLGAEHAYELVYEFLDENPKQEGKEEKLLAHASEIGLVSNQWG